MAEWRVFWYTGVSMEWGESMLESSERVKAILGGRGQGVALALAHAGEDGVAAVAARWPVAAVAALALAAPAHAEHPHSAFVRKPMAFDGKPGLRTTLFAPDGKLVEERLEDGGVLQPFVRRPKDMAVLRGHLRDVEWLPGAAEGGAALALLGRTAGLELSDRWLGGQDTPWTAEDESTASCLRKLERHLRRRGEQAAALGCAAGLLDDCPEGPAGPWLEHHHATLEALRQAGLPCYVAPANPAKGWGEGLRACHAGLCAALMDEELWAAPLPRRLRLLLRATPAEVADGLTDGARALLTACDRVTVLVDCADVGPDALPDALAPLVEVLPH